MLAESLRTRGIYFAFLFGPPRVIERAEASRIHNRICDEFRLDDFAFKYNSAQPGLKEASRGFGMVIERPEGRGRFRIVLDHAGSNRPIRLLLEYQWPVSPDIDAKERFDMAAKAVFDALQGDYRRVLAEARIRAQCEVSGGNARAFILNNLLKLPAGTAGSDRALPGGAPGPDRAVPGGSAGSDRTVPGEAILGAPPTFASVSLHAAPSEPTNDPLADPMRELTVEVLRDDAKSLYLELAVRWPQAPVGTRQLDPAMLRPINEAPSLYVDTAHEILQRAISTLGAGADRTN